MTQKQTKIVLAVASVSLIAALMLMLYYYFVTNVKEEEIDMYTPKYFTLQEMTASSTADSLGIVNTIPDDEIKNNIMSLIMKVLDPVREKYGQAIRINSGYRSPQLNAAVGGSNSSQHVKGQAADLTTGTKDGNKILFDIIREHGEYDQLIDESDFAWVHVSYKRIGYNRKQILKL